MRPFHSQDVVSVDLFKVVTHTKALILEGTLDLQIELARGKREGWETERGERRKTL